VNLSLKSLIVRKLLLVDSACLEILYRFIYCNYYGQTDQGDVPLSKERPYQQDSYREIVELNKVQGGGSLSSQLIMDLLS
jgi:hypothetical protein